MKLSVSAYRAHASAHKKILSSSYQSTLNYGSTAASCSSTQASELFSMDPMTEQPLTNQLTSGQATATMMRSNSGHAHHSHSHHHSSVTKNEQMISSAGGDAQTTTTTSIVTSKDDEESSDCKSPGQRTKSNQRWMKLRTTVQISSAIQKKPPLKREDSFLKRFSTRQIPETQETMEETGSESASGDHDKSSKRRRRYLQKRRTVVNPDENFYFHWLMVLTICILYNLWTLIVRQSFPELQELIPNFWFSCDCISDIIFILDIIVQLRTGYLEQGLMVYDDKKLALHYMRSKRFMFDLAALLPLDILQIRLGTQPLLRFPRFLKVYRSVKFYYIVESRTVWPNLWRVVNLIHILLILAHWFGCFYFLLSEVENFQGDWVYPYRPGDYATLTRKYLGSLYWSTLTLTTIGDLPTPETNAEPSNSVDGPRSLPRRGIKSRLLQFASNYGYIFTIVSYLIGVFIFATIVGQVGNVITNRNANRLEFERLLDGAKTYMRHHKVPGGMKRRVLRWYDYSWSRGRIQGGGDINTALGLLPDKLKTELALHVNLSVLKKVTIFQECQPEFLHDLVLKMKAYIFTPGDSICRKGEVAREMFIIADGILEVLSETGKVLTTMKAGDFFGEIGILNLDGLNKRTADVRSVGYSELFSLSREDVLNAMKDYPEAQDILHTLGRKRLNEVRCVNKKHAKIVADRESIASNVRNKIVNCNRNERRMSERLADKLRSDVKGIKNVFKKSRWATGRRSNESIEMQPLHLKGPKGVLRRMPRVRSDEMHEIATEKEQQQQQQQKHQHLEKEKTPSPIGAGLPLLQRLRLLKEKQDREERAVKCAQAIVSPSQNTHNKSAVSPQQSIQEEDSGKMDVVGPGLPLIKRLLLLKAKEERLANESHAKSVQQTNVSSVQTISDTISSTSMLCLLKATATTNTTSTGLMPAIATSGHGQSSTSSASSISSTKPKVSFRDRIKSLQNTETKRTISMSSSSTSNQLSNATTVEPIECGQLNKSMSIGNLGSSAGPSHSSKLIIKSPISLKDKIKHGTVALKPWSKLKLATVHSGSSYTSLNDSMIETSPTHKQQQQQQPPSQSIRIAKIKQTATATASAPTIITTCKSSPLIPEYKQMASSEKGMKKDVNKIPERICKSDSETRTTEPSSSSEYGGLPFVKKLKILNERQKLAELELVMKARSFSLDCPEWSDADEPIEPLIRSQSECSGMTRPKNITTITASQTMIDVNNGSNPMTPTTTTTTIPLSPESNETIERRELKSILKRLTEEKGSTSIDMTTNNDEIVDEQPNGLLQAPTVEGPPISAHSVNNERCSFPLLSHAQSPTHNSTTFMQFEQNQLQTHTQTHSIAIQSDISISKLVDDDLSNKSRLNVVESIAGDESAIFLHNLSPTTQSQHSNGSMAKNDVADEGDTTKQTFISNKLKIKGSFEEHELFNDVLFGIKNVIHAHMRDIQRRYEDQFKSFEYELCHRDEIIADLRQKIHELGGEVLSPILTADGRRYSTPKSGNGSSGSSGDIPFVRSDSLDTIFASSPPDSHIQKVNRIKTKTKKRTSPRRRRQLEQHQQESTDQEFAAYDDFSHMAMPKKRASMIIDDITGNITQLSDSVILDIEPSSDGSLDGNDDDDDLADANVFEEEDEDAVGSEDQDEELQHDNWEIQMLAAELNRRESKRDEPLSSDASEIIDSASGLSRPQMDVRSDTLDTDTEENSEIEIDRVQRPRAASFDQQTVTRQRAKGILKALSFDRDKYRL